MGQFIATFILLSFKYCSARGTRATTGFGAWGWLADAVVEMGADKVGDGLPMPPGTETTGQFIGHQLKIGRCLQWDKPFEELASFRWPNGQVAATGAPRAEHRSVLKPAGV